MASYSLFIITVINIQGFVTFDEEEHAQKALQDLGRDTTICGKRIDIQPARGKGLPLFNLQHLL